MYLVLDFESNEKSHALFFSFASEDRFKPIPTESYHSPEVIKRMIETLQHSNTPIAKQLIHELKQQLKTK